MTTFHLTVVTPDGCAFDGQAERVVCRAIDGDLAILAKHGDYCTALGMGEAHIVDADGQRRRAACMGGMLSVGRRDRPGPRRSFQKARRGDSGPEGPRQARLRDGPGPPEACFGAYLRPLRSCKTNPGVPSGTPGFLRHSVSGSQKFGMAVRCSLMYRAYSSTPWSV